MRCISAILFIILTIPFYAHAEIETISQTIRQTFGGSQSADDARIAAVAKAKREALEQAGTYVEALTIVKESSLDKDEILAITAGICKAEVISSKNYATEDAFGIEVNVKVLVDTAVLGERVKKMLQDRTHLEQLNLARKLEKQLLAKINQLEAENRKSKSTSKEKKQLTASFQDASRGLKAVELFNSAMELWKKGKNGSYTDPLKAIHNLDEAILLKPDYADAFNMRGMAYGDLGQHNRAISDYNQAIHLNNNHAFAFHNRGAAFLALESYDMAIKSLNEAIRIKPNLAVTYSFRALCYSGLKQYKQEIEDYKKAIVLNPVDFNTQILLGFALIQNGNYEERLEGCNKVALGRFSGAGRDDSGNAIPVINEIEIHCKKLFKKAEQDLEQLQKKQ